MQNCKHEIISMRGLTVGVCNSCGEHQPMESVIFLSGRVFFSKKIDGENRTLSHPSRLTTFHQISPDVWAEGVG